MRRLLACGIVLTLIIGVYANCSTRPIITVEDVAGTQIDIMVLDTTGWPLPASVCGRDGCYWTETGGMRLSTTGPVVLWAERLGYAPSRAQFYTSGFHTILLYRLSRVEEHEP